MYNDVREEKGCRNMIRFAQKEDCSKLYDLLLEIFLDMELEVFKQFSPVIMKQWMVESMRKSDSRYSYKNAVVFVENDHIIGCAFGYKDALEKSLTHSLQETFTENGWEKEQLIFPDAETFAGEWYLDSIVVHSDFRKKGIAQTLIQTLPKLAKSQGETVIGLNCDQENAKARALYEKMGFRKTIDWVIGEHIYDHMQLEVE